MKPNTVFLLENQGEKMICYAEMTDVFMILQQRDMILKCDRGNQIQQLCQILFLLTLK